MVYWHVKHEIEDQLEGIEIPFDASRADDIVDMTINNIVNTGLLQWHNTHDVEAFGRYHRARELRKADGTLVYDAPHYTDWTNLKTTWFKRALFNEYPDPPSDEA